MVRKTTRGRERYGNQTKRELEKPYVHVARSLLTSPPRDLLANAVPQRYAILPGRMARDGKTWRIAF